MRMIRTEQRLPDVDSWCLVYVPGWTESGFEVAEYRDDCWFSQYGQLIGSDVEAWVYLDNLKTP